MADAENETEKVDTAIDGEKNADNSDAADSAGENVNKDGEKEQDEQNPPPRAVSIKDCILYLLLGLVSELDMGYIGSPSFQQYIALPGFNQAPTTFVTGFAQLAGGLLVLLVLSRFIPEIRVIVVNAIQLLGSLFMWFLPSPANNLAGTFFLYLGLLGMIITMIPLTYETGIRASTLYIGGQIFSPLFGTLIIKIFDWSGGGSKAAHMIVLCCYPVIAVLLFFSLDRSVFRKPNKEDIESLEEQEEENMKQMSGADYWKAIKEFIIPYAVLYALYCFALMMWNAAILSPNLMSSSLTYSGITNQADLLNQEDNITVVSMLMSLPVALSLLTPIGKIIPKASPHVLFIPVTIIVVLVIVSSVGLITGSFPPLSVGLLYTFVILVNLSVQAFMGYIPLFFRCDPKLTEEYREKQVQMGIVFSSIMTLIASAFVLYWFQPTVAAGCAANYQTMYPGVNCTNLNP